MYLQVFCMSMCLLICPALRLRLLYSLTAAFCEWFWLFLHLSVLPRVIWGSSVSLLNLPGSDVPSLACLCALLPPRSMHFGCCLPRRHNTAVVVPQTAAMRFSIVCSSLVPSTFGLRKGGLLELKHAMSAVACRTMVFSFGFWSGQACTRVAGRASSLLQLPRPLR